MTTPSSTPSPKVSFWSVFGPQLRLYRWQILLAMVMVGISGTAQGLQNIYPKWLFTYVLEPKELTTEQRLINLLMLIGSFLLVTMIMRMAMWHLGYRIFTRVRERIVLHLRAQFFSKVNHLCLRFHGEHPSGELFSYLFGSPLGNMVNFVQHCSMFIPASIMTLVMTLGMFLLWDWQVALVLIVGSLACVWMMDVSRRKQHVIWKDFQQVEGNVSGHVADLLRGSKAVKLYSMERTVADEFNQQATTIGKKSYERDVKAHFEWMKQEGLGYLTFSALMAICTYSYLTGRIDLGTVTACLTSYAGLTWPLQTLFQAMTMYASAAASAERLGTVLITASTTPDPVGPELPVPAQGTLALTGVAFAYGTETILQDITVSIPYGQKVAVVGPSGGGKSTLIQLLLRLYDPATGTVTLDGTDLRHLRGAELRRRFGVVPQDPFIFRTSIRENLKVARPDADDAALRRACEQANAWEFISQMPAGLDTPVGEGGSTLSGGQRQRLAIARVLLAEPPFLIFDEATSALDTLSERLIQEAIERNLGNRTAIFIAHRLATVKNVDRILVVQQGRIIQDGSYADLAATPGLFKQLVEGQQLL